MTENITAQELEAVLENIVVSTGQSTMEYVESKGFATQEEVNTNVLALEAKVNAITEMEDNGEISLAEMVKQIKDAVSSEDGVVASIYQSIQDNKTALEQVASDLVSTDSKLTTLNGSASTVGSVAHAISNESTKRVEQENKIIDSVNANAQAVKELQSDNGASLDGLDGRVSTVENILQDTEDDEGNVTTGLVAKVATTRTMLVEEIAERKQDVEKSLADSKQYTNDMILKVSDINTDKINNALRVVYGLALDDSNDGQVAS